MPITYIKKSFEFLGDFVSAVKDTPWPEAVAKAMPWTELVGEAIADSVAPVKFILKLYEKATSVDDPNELGMIACSTAFQRSVEQAFKRFPPEEKQTIDGGSLPPIELEEKDYDFSAFDYESALQHEYYRDSRMVLEHTLAHLGLEESRQREILGLVDSRFVANLQFLLASRETAEKFHPFLSLVSQGEFHKHYEALEKHADYQRWLYESKPVLGNPFSLAHIYVETDCGVLNWSEIESKIKATADSPKRFSPFVESEDTGGREDLLKTTLSLLKDEDFHDAIVIQGHAGAGKSAFTLRLCNELIAEGLRPIRIELKHLDAESNKSIDDRLPQAVRLGEFDYDKSMQTYIFDGDLFNGNRIFSDTFKYGTAEISRYVIILDAWDEVSVGASAGYQEQINQLLESIRSRYLDRTKNNYDIRVILCGRPSDAIGKASFMRDNTTVLTVRPLRPEAFETLVQRTGIAVKSKPIPIENWAEWSLADIQGEIPKLFNRYRENFEEATQDEKQKEKTLEILGLPLLAQLSLRLLAHWDADLEKILDNTTVLYRSLVDLVIDAGKPPGATQETLQTAQFHGKEHRELLQHTAMAITLVGQEHISYEELDCRLSDANINLDGVLKIDDENLLSKLMISFFFKAGHKDLGCEFSHKSFREFLFAEYIVEILKKFGRDERKFSLRAKEDYWREYLKDDPRFDLSRNLANSLGPKWLTSEVTDHVTNLIEWEVLRTFRDDPYPVVGIDKNPIGATEELTPEQWERVRDGLADLWDWWGEGIHMRPQPYYEESGNRGIKFHKTLVAEVAERDVRLSQLGRRDPLPQVTRVYSIDAHLGDGLLQLCSDVHRAIAVPNWPPKEAFDWMKATALGKGPRPYQTAVGNFVLFAPSNGNSSYFRWYLGRIESAGYHARGWIPQGKLLAATDLRNCNFDQVDWVKRPDLSDSCFINVAFYGAYLTGANLTGAVLSGVNLIRARLSGADLPGADLGGAHLSGADLGEANLTGADLTGADLIGADLIGADLREADLREADLRGADLRGAELIGADLRGVKNANLQGAIMDGTTKLDSPDAEGDAE